MNLSDELKIGLAQPHLALVMENGSVWNIQSNDQFKTIEKNLLIQLPKSENYYTFSTKTGVLNFVQDDISSNIIQYHNSLNNQNHTTVKRSSIKFNDDNDLSSWSSKKGNFWAGLRFKHGLQVGSMFWLIFVDLPAFTSSLNFLNQITTVHDSTMIWFSNKQRWRRGPDLQPNEKKEVVLYDQFAGDNSSLKFIIKFRKKSCSF